MNLPKTVSVASEKETMDLARAIARNLGDRDTVLLEGELGTGKSCFARELIRTLAEDAVLIVPSPTFTLVQVYDTRNGQVFHYDLYRLKGPEEVLSIGWEDTVSRGITLVEWPDRLGYLRPRQALEIRFARDPSSPDGRTLTIEDTRGKEKE